MAGKNNLANLARKALKASGILLTANSAGRARMADGFVNTAKLDPQVVQYTKVSLTNAEIKALRATPKQLVAAPGAGYLIVVAGQILVLNAGVNALTETADNIGTIYAGASTILTAEATGFLDQTTDQFLQGAPANDLLITKANGENKAVQLKNLGDGEWGGNAAADATLDVHLWYRTVPTGW